MLINPNPDEVAALFQHARELSPLERNNLLSTCDPHLRDEVLSLLRHDVSPHPLIAGFSEPAEGRGVWNPTAIGPFKVIRLIGEGGGGMVFEASDTPLDRRVAIKAMLPGRFSVSSLRRFEQEARALAVMEHPSIARIIQIGTAYEGTLAFPYIAMEFIDGLRLDQFARQNKLSRARRLELMAAICDAVQYAHQKGIIHRDLKPSNILVEPDGTPRILDFGIARLASAEEARFTMTGEVLGTPPYLSPEQASGDWRRVDTRSDIFSLGVLLLETLSDEHLIADLDRTAPIEVPRALRGDLAAVIRKAAAPNPEERYATASELAADLRRAIRHEPVLARRHGGWLRSFLFLRRHKPLVVAALAVVLGAAIAGWQAHRANENFRTLTDVLVSLCAGPSVPTLEDESYRQLVNRVRTLDFGDSVQQADVCMNMASMMQRDTFTPHAAAAELLRTVVATRTKELGADHPETLRARISLASAMLGDPVAAELEARELLRRLGDRSMLAPFAKLALATALSHQSRYREALTTLGDLADSDNPVRIFAKYRMGDACYKIGEFQRAIEYHEEVDRILRSSRLCDGMMTTNLIALASCVLAANGDVATARGYLEQASHYLSIDATRREMDEANIRMNLAGCQWSIGDYAECETQLREIQKLFTERSGYPTVMLDECRSMLGVCLRDQRKWTEAESLLRGVFEARSHALGPDDPTVSNAKVNLAKLLVRADRSSELPYALDLATSALQSRLRGRGETSPEYIECEALCGEILVAMGRYKEGWAQLEHARALLKEGRDGNWMADLIADSYAYALTRVGEVAKAEAFLQEELDRARAGLREGHLVTHRRELRLGRFRELWAGVHTGPAAVPPGSG